VALTHKKTKVYYIETANFIVSHVIPSTKMYYIKSANCRVYLDWLDKCDALLFLSLKKAYSHCCLVRTLSLNQQTHTHTHACTRARTHTHIQSFPSVWTCHALGCLVGSFSIARISRLFNSLCPLHLFFLVFHQYIHLFKMSHPFNEQGANFVFCFSFFALHRCMVFPFCCQEYEFIRVL